MAHKVFIDGEVGTTGLQIRERLQTRDDIDLITIPMDKRKDLDARLSCLNEADVGIMCLPDTAAIEIAREASKMTTRLIDASTAHRVHDDWVFGFAELGTDRRKAIAGAKYVSNPGCYSTGAIALLHPLSKAGLIAADTPISINATSGYTGGGKAMVEEFETGQTDGFFVYGTAQQHKHVPEIMAYGGVSKRPVFVPSVGHYAQGMIVQIPLPMLSPDDLGRVEGVLRDHYSDSHFVRVVDAAKYGARLDPRVLNGTNHLEISVHGAVTEGCGVLVAILDNLGKGASGAAVQNLNIMLGIDEATGL